jgi:hypothetical protein
MKFKKEIAEYKVRWENVFCKDATFFAYKWKIRNNPL